MKTHNIFSHFTYLQTINFDSPRGGISLVTEKGILTTSRLLVQKAIPSDSGKKLDTMRCVVSISTMNYESQDIKLIKFQITHILNHPTGLYQCLPSNANPASVRVHILNGKTHSL